MKERWWKDKFHILIIAVTYLVVAFVVMVLITVIIKGLPHVGQSLFLPEIQFAIKLSCYTSLISTALCILVAIPVAYVLARLDLPFKHLMNTLIDLPLSLPPIVSGVCLLMVFGTTFLGAWLEQIGLTFVFTIKGIIAAQLFVNLPMMTRVIKSAFLSVEPRLEFVARGLGCTAAQAFFQVTLPLSKNGIIAGAVITWSRALGEFGAVLMLAGATRFRTETLPIALFLNMSTGDLDAAMAVANILIIISLISLYFFNKFGGDYIGNTRGI